MKEEVGSFYESLRSLYSEILRIRSKTISTREFKEKSIGIYEEWETQIESMLRTLGIESDVLTHLDFLFENIYEEASMRVADVSHVRDRLSEINNIFLKQILPTLKEEESSEPTMYLMEAASFLGLDTNWSLATCALQLQEVAIVLVAKSSNITLNKSNVERILNKKVQTLSFNDRYEAFSRQVETSFGIEMPILTKHLRKMRTKVLHEGYNPKPEETDSIVGFTIGLLQKLSVIK